MKKIKFTYIHETWNGILLEKEYIADDDKDYQRVVDIICNNPDEYKVISVEHVEIND